jgi:hypothetical protein
MQVGAIGSVSSLSAMPYIYNTNRVSSASLNKVSAIQGDTQSGKTDFSGLTSGETTNPLKRGETSNFVDVLAMQFSMAQSNASRTMKDSSQNISQQQTQMPDSTATGRAEQAGQADQTEQLSQNGQSSGNLYKMNQAISAYSLNMTA